MYRAMIGASFVSGGFGAFACGCVALVSGGFGAFALRCVAFASRCVAFVSGGFGAFGCGCVVGASFVSGGFGAFACGCVVGASFVSGGFGAFVSWCVAFVSGGFGAFVSWCVAFVSGGFGAFASRCVAFVSGGFRTFAFGSFAIGSFAIGSFAIAFGLACLSGCYRPAEPACGFLCGPGGACPDGYACNAADGFCHRDGTDVTCELDLGVDAFDFFPRVASVAPEDMSTEVALDVTPTVKFTERVIGVSATSFTLTPRDGAGPVAATVAYDETTRTASLDPDELLEASIHYDVALGSDIVDASGKALVGPTGWTFKTMADLTPPMLIATVPENGAKGVPRDIVIVATFSERVASVSTSTFSLADAAGPVSGTVGFVSLTQERFTPNGVLAPNTFYTVTLTAGIVDLKGNALANAPVTWSFETGDR